MIGFQPEGCEAHNVEFRLRKVSWSCILGCLAALLLCVHLLLLVNFLLLFRDCYTQHTIVFNIYLLHLIFVCSGTPTSVYFVNISGFKRFLLNHMPCNLFYIYIVQFIRLVMHWIIYLLNLVMLSLGMRELGFPNFETYKSKVI